MRYFAAFLLLFVGNLSAQEKIAFGTSDVIGFQPTQKRDIEGILAVSGDAFFSDDDMELYYKNTCKKVREYVESNQLLARCALVIGPGSEAHFVVDSIQEFNTFLQASPGAVNESFQPAGNPEDSCRAAIVSIASRDISVRNGAAQYLGSNLPSCVEKVSGDVVFLALGQMLSYPSHSDRNKSIASLEYFFSNDNFDFPCGSKLVIDEIYRVQKETHMQNIKPIAERITARIEGSPQIQHKIEHSCVASSPKR